MPSMLSNSATTIFFTRKPCLKRFNKYQDKKLSLKGWIHLFSKTKDRVHKINPPGWGQWSSSRWRRGRQGTFWCPCSWQWWTAGWVQQTGRRRRCCYRTRSTRPVQKKIWVDCGESFPYDVSDIKCVKLELFLNPRTSKSQNKSKDTLENLAIWLL